MIMPDELTKRKSLPEVGGRVLTTSITDFIFRCQRHIEYQQDQIAPDTALIALLCDGIRLAREFIDFQRGSL